MSEQHATEQHATEPHPEQHPGDPAATSGDWRARLRQSKVGSLAVLGTTLAVVLTGAWLVNRSDSEPAAGGSGGTGGAQSVTLEGDQSGSAPEVGQPAPGFTATTMDGKQVSLASLKGKPVWITFGATWCTACRAEAPDIEAAWQAGKPKGVTVLAVFIKEDAATVRGYANRLNLSFPMVSDPNTELASRYRSIGIPSHFFIDGEGVLRKSHVGALTAEQMQQNLAEIGG
ncbi:MULTISPECIES: TlpA family protein disulfide reductase [unclassified Luteococcus]|uniref:TlpA family protein disulfide reductase n=1 Tax=unclassified Luteococcus TaxID=2639923 RepID=UPI00313EB08C